MTHRCSKLIPLGVIARDPGEYHGVHMLPPLPPMPGVEDSGLHPVPASEAFSLSLEPVARIFFPHSGSLAMARPTCCSRSCAAFRSAASCAHSFVPSAADGVGAASLAVKRGVVDQPGHAHVAERR